MGRNRQDGWTKDEDHVLANIILNHIKTGKTQLDAFKKVAKQLSRTPAACGFRWNATVRKQYEEEISKAKIKRKKFIKDDQTHKDLQNNPKANTVDIAISLLEKMKEQIDMNSMDEEDQNEQLIIQLKAENEQLKKMLQLYHDGWSEMNKVWDWVKEQRLD